MCAMITLKYPWGVMAHIQVSGFNPKKVRQITVVGDQRMLTWDDLELAAPISRSTTKAPISARVSATSGVYPGVAARRRNTASEGRLR